MAGALLGLCATAILRHMGSNRPRKLTGPWATIWAAAMLATAQIIVALIQKLL
jgi:hypothetical protein